MTGSLPPDCRVFVDGVRMADGGTPGEVDTDPVVLTDLRVTWGRDNTLDQPEPSTCAFTVLDVAGGARALDRLNIGSAVDVVAAAIIPADPTVPTIDDPGFEAAAIGSTPPSSPTNATVRVVAGGAVGAHAARIEPVDGRYAATVVFPPGPFSANPSAWDGRPRSRVGQAWHYGLTVARFTQQLAGLPGVSVEVEPVGFTAPRADAVVRYASTADRLRSPVDAPAGWIILAGDTYPPDALWLGLRVVIGFGPAWDDVGAALAWDAVAAGLRWDDLGGALVDDLVMTAPAGGAQRQGAVFSGRITDLEARYDQAAGGTLVDVTAESHLAELGNRYVGDTPWLAQSLAARFGAIVAASGQGIAYTVDPGVAGYVVSWRDVDAQPAARLLAELAQSCAGALWLATSLTTGPYLWLEDIDSRPATAVLVRTGGVVGIVVNPAGAGLLSLSSCDVLLDPVRWVQTTEDDSTRIAVRWLEQTVNGQGQPAPTERTSTFVDDAAELASGQRRIGLSTELTTSSDAKRVGDAVLGRVRSPGWRVAGLTIRLDLAEPLDADLLSLVMTILDATTRIGAGLMLTDLPAWSPAGTGDVPLYLEGGRFSNVDGAWELDLLTSDARAQGESKVAWDDLPGGTLTRTNRGTNPRAVTGGAAQWNRANWGTGGAGSVSFITGVTAPAGTNIGTAYRATWTTAATSASGAAFSITADATSRMPVTAGTTYTVSCFVRHSTGIGTKNYEILVRFYNQTTSAGSAQVGADTTSSAVAVAEGVAWTRLSFTVTAPAGAAALAIFPRMTVASSGAIAVNATQDITGLLVEAAAGPAGAYFDGDSADTAGVTDNAWTGTVNASTSTQTDLSTGWQWDQFDPAITWNDLAGVGMP